MEQNKSILNKVRSYLITEESAKEMTLSKIFLTSTFTTPTQNWEKLCMTLSMGKNNIKLGHAMYVVKLVPFFI